ncbi:MAG: MBL fold metallo-hydrolase, partial [Opitutaceae bacterium]
EEVHDTFPADAIYIFGHGSPKFGVTGTRDDLLVMRDLFQAMLDHVQRGIAAGRTRDQIINLDNLPGFPDFHVPQPNRLPGNLGAVYDELTAKG